MYQPVATSQEYPDSLQGFTTEKHLVVPCPMEPYPIIEPYPVESFLDSLQGPYSDPEAHHLDS